MKTFIVFASNQDPYKVEADNYVRHGGSIEFRAGAVLVNCIEASQLLTIVEDKPDYHTDLESGRERLIREDSAAWSRRLGTGPG